MKKLVFFLLLLAPGLITINGQLYPPIQPYLENDYSISQVKEFAMASTELSSNWRTELLSIVNNGLAEAGENMILDESSIYWILDHVTYERRNLISFTNSRRIGNKINFFLDRSNFDGMVAIFNYGKCSLVLFKTRCMNLLKVPVQTVQVEPKFKPTVSFSTTKQQEDWSFASPRKIYEETVNLNLYQPPVTVKKNKWVKWVVGGVVLSAVTTYLIMNHSHHYDGGGPGGASKTDPVIVPPVVVPGGPGGAPKTP